MSRTGILGLAALLAIPLGVSSGRASTPPPIVFAADLAPAVTGEIYRLDPNGRREDLSKSTWQDTNPAVSTDGKRVAFFSDRSGKLGVYEVGINGGGLVQVAKPPGGGYSVAMDWQPHGSALAAEWSGGVLLLRPHRKPIAFLRRYRLGTLGNRQQPWSPDGRILLLWEHQNVMRAISPQGHTQWSVGATQPISAWSPQGLFAVPIQHGGVVYDESGRLRFKFQLPASNARFAWSADGRYLAASWYGKKSQKLQVRTAGGTLRFEGIAPDGDMAWAGDSEVVFGVAGCGTCQTRGVDVRTGKISPASSRWLGPFSPDRKLAIVTPTQGAGFSLGVAPPAGGPERAYEHVGDCLSYGSRIPAVSSLQFAGRTRSIVYQSWSDCDPPFANLYSMASDSTLLRRLTNVDAQETQPAISPDASRLAYVWASAVGISCSGCSDGIRIAGIDGTDLHTLTNPQDCTFDDSPTWSPDGSTILYAETGCDSPSELYTIPASGGSPHDLGVAGNSPVWGPSRIAYVRGDQSDGGLWTANPDGSDPVKVAANGRKPAWSFDGRLAYLTGSAGTTLVVGSAHVTLPFASIASLAWSPDGTQFVIVARKKSAPAYDVYTVKTDGTGLTRLTFNYGTFGASW